MTGVKLSVRHHESDLNLNNIELEGTFDQIKRAYEIVQQLKINLIATTGPHQQQNSFGKPGGGFGGPAGKFKTNLNFSSFSFCDFHFHDAKALIFCIILLPYLLLRFSHQRNFKNGLFVKWNNPLWLCYEKISTSSTTVIFTAVVTLRLQECGFGIIKIFFLRISFLRYNQNWYVCFFLHLHM